MNASMQASLGQLPRWKAHVASAVALDPLDHEVFQGLFGMVMTLLIALERKHSIARVATRRESSVQMKTVLLIALLPLSRKFVILDATSTGPLLIAALAFATLVLGAVYWLLRERDDRVTTRGRAGHEEE